MGIWRGQRWQLLINPYFRFFFTHFGKLFQVLSSLKSSDLSQSLCMGEPIQILLGVKTCTAQHSLGHSILWLHHNRDPP